MDFVFTVCIYCIKSSVYFSSLVASMYILSESSLNVFLKMLDFRIWKVLNIQ